MEKEINKEKTIEQIQEEIIKTNNSNNLAELRKLYADGFTEIEKIKTKISKIYYSIPICFLIAILINAIMFFSKLSIVWFIAINIFIFPLIAFGFIITLVKLYRDRQKIKNKLVKSISTYFICANFFMPNHKIRKCYFRLSNKTIFLF